MKKIYADTCNKIVAGSVAAQDKAESVQRNRQQTHGGSQSSTQICSNNFCDYCSNKDKMCEYCQFSNQTGDYYFVGRKLHHA